jgi:hypothetical protein
VLLWVAVVGSLYVENSVDVNFAMDVSAIHVELLVDHLTSNQESHIVRKLKE